MNFLFSARQRFNGMELAGVPLTRSGGGQRPRPPRDALALASTHTHTLARKGCSVMLAQMKKAAALAAVCMCVKSAFARCCSANSAGRPPRRTRCRTGFSALLQKKCTRERKRARERASKRRKKYTTAYQRSLFFAQENPYF